MSEFTGERFMPEIENEELTTEHMQRYISILPIVKGKKVVDIACGEGYGTNILAGSALDIVGIDINKETVENASKKYRKNNLHYKVGSVANIPLKSNSVDVIVSYETIEHVDEEAQKSFLKETKRVLKQDGVLIISTPNKELYSDRYHYHNEFHIKEFYKQEFIQFIKSSFEHLQLYNQYDEVVNVIENTDDTKEALLFKNEKREGKYYVVVASDGELPTINQVIKVRSTEEYARCITRIVELQKEEEERNTHICKLDEEIKEKNSFIESLQENIAKDKAEYEKCMVRIVELQKAEEERNAHIGKLDNEIMEKNSFIENLQENIAKDKAEYEKCMTRIVELQEGEEKRNAHISKLDNEITEKNNFIENLQENIVKDKAEYDKCMARIVELQKAEEERNAHIGKLDNEIKEKNSFIENLQESIAKDKAEYDKCMARIVELQEGEEKRNTHISKLDNEIKEKNNFIKDLQENIAKDKAEYDKCMARIVELQEGEEKRNQHIAVLDGEIKEKNEYITILQKEVNEKDININKKQEEIKSLMDTVEKLKYETKFAEQLIANMEKNNDELRVLTEEYRGQIQSLMNHANDKNEKIEKIIEEREQNKAKATILEQKLEDAKEKNLAAEQKLQQCNESILKQKEELLRLNFLLQEKQKALEELSVSKQEVLKDNQKLEKEKEDLFSELEQATQIMKELQNSLEEISATKQELQNSLDSLNVTKQELKSSFDNLSIEKQLLQNSYEEINAQKQALQNGYEMVTTEKQALQNRISEIEQELRNKEGHIELLLESDRALERLNVERQALQEKISEMEQELRNKQGHIDLLLESDRELERLKVQMDKRLMVRIFPRASKRRLFAKLAVKCVRHPIKTIKLIFTKGKVKNFFRFLKKDGVLFVSKLVDDNYRGVEVEKQQLLITQVTEGKDISEYQPLTFEKQKKPQVSIVIPVYNQFDYTYNCLKSILHNSGTVTYEIIIANDCSTDLTTRINEVIKNIKVVTNQTNLRFLKNCNNAAKYAKGKYILFLNNDTQVQPNWLAPLVELIERDSSIGMVGSKLVYADGRLQEAGGILWNDGSAWNYGNRKDPEDPEYNYVKEADYISGAAIMIKTSLWKEIGGFDENFAPAYCEDSDLAFEVRKHGYKVMYQPLSVVVHFEGVSNGTDTSSGQKAYQVINSKKFLEKWKDVLQTEHFPNAENVFVARDKNRNKSTLLMIDHYVPQYDKDAGSRTVFQYLKMFVKMGYNVKFIGDNFYKHEPYTTVLQQMGIEVLYGPYYANNWKTWIKENAKHIQYVFLNRPHISVKYIDFIREHTNARIMYYGHDLHFLREMRRYELEGDKKALQDSADWKEKELKLMRQADVVYYPSQVEADAIRSIDSNIPVKAIVAYIFDDVVKEVYDYKNRKDIMFVGGFTHTPNVDAVLWFVKEVFPNVLKQNPNIKFYIMGSNPPEQILALASENVIVKGFVTDEELEWHYKNCRMSIVPLRYGAGIKGKVVEAMKYGIPVITTSVGAEGIIGAEHILCIEDEASNLSEKIISLYSDKSKLMEMSEHSYEYIKYHFSVESAWNIVEKDFK